MNEATISFIVTQLKKKILSSNDGASSCVIPEHLLGVSFILFRPLFLPGSSSHSAVSAWLPKALHCIRIYVFFSSSGMWVKVTACPTACHKDCCVYQIYWYCRGSSYSLLPDCCFPIVYKIGWSVCMICVWVERFYFHPGNSCKLQWNCFLHNGPFTCISLIEHV